MPVDWTPQEPQPRQRSNVDFGNVDNATQILKLKQIIDQNKDKNFVQRMISPQQYPQMDRPDLGKGIISTHLMSYSTNDKGAVAYPQIIYDDKTKQLQRLDPKTAYEHAVKTGENIPFPSEQEAAWFTENYKKALDMQAMKNLYNANKNRVVE